MTAPKSLNAYKDCEAHFERALASKKGIRVRLDTPKLATMFRFKMNIYRDKLRKQAKGVYPPEHPQHNTSPYDALQLTIDPLNPSAVLIRPYEIQINGVEEL